MSRTSCPIPKITLFRGNTWVAENDTWGGTPDLVSTFVRLGAFALVNSSLDAALLSTVSGGHTLQVFGPAGNVLVELYDAGDGLTPRLTNLSARNRVGTGADILIVGLVIDGTAPKSLLVRAVGPGLSAFGVTGVLADPKVGVFTSTQTRIAENDTWDPGLAATFAAAGAFPLAGRLQGQRTGAFPRARQLHLAGLRRGRRHGRGPGRALRTRPLGLGAVRGGVRIRRQRSTSRDCLPRTGSRRLRS
jgi:hypothetical protein